MYASGRAFLSFRLLKLFLLCIVKNLPEFKNTNGKQYRRHGKCKVLALHANYSAETMPLFYAIEYDGKQRLYAYDTGYTLKRAIRFAYLSSFSLIARATLGLAGNGVTGI